MDASLRGVLEATLQPDDNDLFLSNLVSLLLMVIHGSVNLVYSRALDSDLNRGNDRNVPTWHSRELVEGLKRRYPQHGVM
jgi:hypothetical protein